MFKSNRRSYVPAKSLSSAYFHVVDFTVDLSGGPGQGGGAGLGQGVGLLLLAIPCHHQVEA